MDGAWQANHYARSIRFGKGTSQDGGPSVAIVHPQIGRGGSEARVMWGAEALKDKFAVSIISTGGIDLRQLDEFYGTSIAGSGSVSVFSLPIPRLLARHDSMAAMRGAFYQRALRRVIGNYTVAISAYNFANFGMPGIHCLADFSWDENVRSKHDPVPAGLRGIAHNSKYLRMLYLKMTSKISQSIGYEAFSGNDLVLANSHWTARVFRARYGTEPSVLYPPVTLSGAAEPFEHRNADFVCIGRIQPEKRIERIIEIIRRVRLNGHCVRLRIIGPLDDSLYARKICSLACTHREWVLLEGSKSGEAKATILSSSRYGIHAREGEAFGIGVAEMIKAGCVTFAPVEGGPAEILDNEALLYRGDNEAVAKISAVLKDEQLRQALSHHLQRQADKFSAQNFMQGLRAVVESFIRSKEAVASNVLMPIRQSVAS